MIDYLEKNRVTNIQWDLTKNVPRTESSDAWRGRLHSHKKILTLSTSLSVFSSFALQPFRVPPDTFHWLQNCEFELADIWLQDIKFESSPNRRIYSFYDDCCQSESGALWEILASGIHASAFMPLLVKSRLEDCPNNPSRRCSRICFRTVNQQKGPPNDTAVRMSLNGKVILAPFQKTKAQNKSTCAECRPGAHSRWHLTVVILSLNLKKGRQTKVAQRARMWRRCTVYVAGVGVGVGGPAQTGWV